jgi:hypothetical protein
MPKNTRAAMKVVPALCAIMIALLLTVLRPAHASDFTLGTITGILVGLSIVSVVSLKRRPS